MLVACFRWNVRQPMHLIFAALKVTGHFFQHNKNQVRRRKQHFETHCKISTQIINEPFLPRQMDSNSFTREEKYIKIIK